MSDLLDAAEVQSLLGISAPTFYRWLKSGKLRGSRVGRHWRFRREDIDALLEPTSPAHDVLEVVRQRLLARLPSSAAEEPPMQPTEQDLARLALRAAFASRAESLHLEPGERWQLRERVDGRLVPLQDELPQEAGEALARGLASLLALPDAPAASARRALTLGDAELQVQAVRFPTPRGPSLAMKLVDPAIALPVLDDLGLSADTVARLRALLRRGHGTLVVNGPTGSGKSTTLYLLLKELARPHRKCMTIEDPVELLIDDTVQGQVEPGFGFPEALQAMMRSDIDVALVSEVRTPDVARQVLAMGASGHLVLTALHAPAPAEALARLAAHDAELTAAAVIGVLDQRLLPAACPSCAVERALTADEARVVPTERGVSAAGCEACQDGVRGRTAIGSLVEVDEATRAQLRRGQAPTLGDWRDDLPRAVASGQVTIESALAAAS